MKGNQYAVVKGRLTENPEVTTSKSGKKYFKVGLAVNSKAKNQEGNMEEVTTFYNLLAFDKLAEIYSNLKKGQYVHAEGRLSVKSYLSKNGEAKVDLTIAVEEILPIQ